MQILSSDNANFALKNCNGILKQTAQNSALRKWKFCTQEMEIPRFKMEILLSENVFNIMENWLFCNFSAPNRVILRYSVFKLKLHTKFRDHVIMEGLYHEDKLS